MEEVGKTSGTLRLQGLAAKVVQGEAGGRPELALVARCLYLAEMAYVFPRWQDWETSLAAGGPRFVRCAPQWPDHPQALSYAPST